MSRQYKLHQTLVQSSIIVLTSLPIPLAFCTCYVTIPDGSLISLSVSRHSILGAFLVYGIKHTFKLRLMFGLTSVQLFE